jgi:hypothetical protein
MYEQHAEAMFVNAFSNPNYYNARNKLSKCTLIFQIIVQGGIIVGL